MSSKRNHSIDLPYDFFTQNIFSLNLSVFAPLREDSFNLLFFYLSAFAPLREDSFDLLFFYLSAFVYPVGPEDRTGAPLREYSFDLSFFLHLSVFAPLREDLFDLSFFYLSAFAPLRETIYLIFHFPTAFAGSETALVAKYFSTRLFMLSSFSGTIPMTTESSGK